MGIRSFACSVFCLLLLPTACRSGEVDASPARVPPEAPAAAVGADLGVLLGHLETRHGLISIYTGADGGRYSLVVDGETKLIGATEEELERAYPDIFELVRGSTADLVGIGYAGDVELLSSP